MDIPFDEAMSNCFRKGLFREQGHVQALHRLCEVIIARTGMFHRVFLNYPSVLKEPEPEPELDHSASTPLPAFLACMAV